MDESAKRLWNATSWQEPAKPLTRAKLLELAAKLRSNGLPAGTPLQVTPRGPECQVGHCEACSKAFGLYVAHYSV